MVLTAIGLCFGVGVSLGMVGATGSILSIPILVYVAGIAPRTAIPMSLALVGSTSLASAALHWRKGNVELKTAVVFAAFGAAGAYVGSLGTHRVSERTLMTLFAVLMLVAGWRMAVRARAGKTAGGGPERARDLRVVPPIGFAVGTMTGFLGVGGGFLALPALVLLIHVPMRAAVGTTLTIVFLNSLSGLASHLPRAHLDWGLTAAFVAATVVGGVVGQAVSHKVRAESLQAAFAALVVVLGLFVLLKNLLG